MDNVDIVVARCSDFVPSILLVFALSHSFNPLVSNPYYCCHVFFRSPYGFSVRMISFKADAQSAAFCCKIILRFQISSYFLDLCLLL